MITATITEDYVSFKVAKLLKEKGFPQEYDIHNAMVYNEEDYEDEYEVQRMVTETKLVKAGTLSPYPASVPEPKCYCPTLQMAMKWLREVHGICIYCYNTNDRIKEYGKYEAGASWIQDDVSVIFYDNSHSLFADTYEQALELVLEYCLISLIK